jgi:hypothetical protein
MNREVHVRFWESPEVKVLRATRHERWLAKQTFNHPAQQIVFQDHLEVINGTSSPDSFGAATA